MKKINWLDHFVNFFVVVASISVAFTLNSWKANSDQNKLKGVYHSVNG